MLKIPLLLSLAGWLAFVIYWSAAAKNSSPEVISESRKSRQVHELLVNFALLLLFVSIPGLNQRVLPNASFMTWTGLSIQTVFGSLAVWARRHLGAHWSGEITVKLDHRLVQSGPYQVVRHPIYSAILGMFVGTALVSGQFHAMLGVVIVALAYWRKIRLEEANLSNAFGPTYDAYRRDTWALFPGLF